ncbi:MAG TPA: glycyl-radical enzyme activating protein [Coriobacteriia bacterium]
MRIFARGWSDGFDGPGRRLVYYLKGCNLRCHWCGNPESIAAVPEMLFYPRKSAFASESCPHGAVRDGLLDRHACARCMDHACVERWRDPAFELVGEEITLSNLLAQVEERRPFFGEDGGVTFSGGEPTLQMDALLAAADALRERGVHVAIETNASSPRFHELAGRSDLLICDLKAISGDLHARMTGADNRLILANLASGIAMTVRVPLIRELNFVPEEREKIHRFLVETRPERVGLLLLHRLGRPKYEALGMAWGAEDLTPPDRDDAEAFRLALERDGLAAEMLN